MDVQYNLYGHKIRFTPTFYKNDLQSLTEKQKINKELTEIQLEQFSPIMQEYQQNYHKIHNEYRNQDRKKNQEYKNRIKAQEEKRVNNEMKKVKKEKEKQMLSNLQLKTDEGVMVEPMKIAMQSAMHSHHFYE